jgi:SOS-response transcriptional repressor LexA
MYLKGLVHRELGEGLTEAELSSVVGVSTRTIEDILADKLPEDPAIWEKFARYFSMNADFLRTGGPLHRVFELTENAQHSREMRKVPLLRWNQIEQMITGDGPSHIEETLETDVSGQRTFAVRVKDNSMQPLFSEGEIIFANPELPSEPGHYVVVESTEAHPGGALLRQLKEIGGQFILHPLNRRYGDMPLTKGQRIWGRVVRLRKNL